MLTVHNLLIALALLGPWAVVATVGWLLAAADARRERKARAEEMVNATSFARAMGEYMSLGERQQGQ